MKLNKLNCPRCNSLQKFGLRTRKIDDSISEVFIKCKMCNWEDVVIRGDSSKILKERDLAKLKIRSQKDVALRKTLLERLKK